MQIRHALYAEVPDDGEAGGGAASGEDVVPKTQFIAAINSQNTKHANEMAALRAEMDAKIAAAAKPVEGPKTYTRAELNALVESRAITQDQADSQMDLQIREGARAEAARVATDTVTAVSRKERVDGEIARYTVVAPEVLDETHDTRARIKEEYKFLIELGDKASVETQLKAIRSVLGPIDKLERARNGRPSHEPHREDGGGGVERKPKASDGTYDGLSAREKAHYDKLITNGIYKDKAAVNAELKFRKS